MGSSQSPRQRPSPAKGEEYDRTLELQKRGQDLYRQKQYESALECFTQAVKQDHEIPTSVLDNRAATHIRLGNLRAALNDGYKMIRRDKTDCTGYLRTGKILQLMGNHTMARDLYEMGVNKVPSNDMNFVLLQQLYEKLVRHTAPRAVDPFQTLPLELIEMVLSSLEFREICNCLRVSSLWYRLLVTTPKFWTNLDFSITKKLVTLEAIKKYVKQGKGFTTRVTLPKVGRFGEGVPLYITTRCKSLQELAVCDGLVGSTLLQAVPRASNLRSLTLGRQCQLTSDCVDRLLDSCKELERAEFHNVTSTNRYQALWKTDFPKLRSLVLNCRTQTPSECNILDFNKIIERIPNICYLNFRGWCAPVWLIQSPDFSALSQLETLDVDGLNSKAAPRLPTSLHTLDISNYVGPKPEITVDQLKRLTRLSVAANAMTVHGLKDFLNANKGNLTHLNAKGCSLLCQELGDLIKSDYFMNVVELNLGDSGFSDDVAALLAGHGLAIQSLQLANTMITGVGIRSLITGLHGTLKFLELDNCLHCGKDAVDWANIKGVKTSFRFPDSKKANGRKVRWL